MSAVGILTPPSFAILADTHFITNPHKAAAAAAPETGQRPNIADHYARSNARRLAQMRRQNAVRSEQDDDQQWN
jgi:hypothetical protein